jgi:hypothetical protein
MQTDGTLGHLTELVGYEKWIDCHISNTVNMGFQFTRGYRRQRRQSVKGVGSTTGT